MDILTYINRMNQIYGDKTQVASITDAPFMAPELQEDMSPMPNIPDLLREEGIEVGEQVKAPTRYNTMQYLQGGRVGYKPGGIVEPGVTHYAKTELTVLKEKLAGITKSRNTMDQVSGLLDEVYTEFKKQNKRPPTLTEWTTAAGTDSSTINRLRKKGNYPLGENIEKRKKGITKRVEKIQASIKTGLQKDGTIKYADKATKNNIKTILTEWGNLPKNTAESAAYGGKQEVLKRLRAASRELASLGDTALEKFMGAANKDLNIKKVVQTKSATLARPNSSSIEENILRDLTEHIRQGGNEFKYVPGSNKTTYGQLKIIDNKTGDILTKDSIKKFIAADDLRFREYKMKFDQLSAIKNTPYTHPITGVKTTLAKTLKETLGFDAIHLQHEFGKVKSPLNNLSPATWKQNMAAKMDLSEEGTKLFGVRKEGMGPKINPDKFTDDLIKFADRKILQTEASGFVKTKTPKQTLALNLEKGTPLHTELMKYCPSKKQLVKKAGGGRIGFSGTCSIDEAATGLKNELSKVKNPAQLGKFGKIGRLAGGFFGWVDAPIEILFALPGILKGDKDEALRNTTLGLFGAGKTEMEKLKPGTALYNVAKNIKDVQDYTNNLFQAKELEAYTTKLEGMLKKYPNDPTIEDDLAQANLQKQKIIDNTQTIIKDYREVTGDERIQARKELRAQETASAKEGFTITDVPFVGDVKIAPYGKPKDLSNVKDYIENKGDPYYRAIRVADENLGGIMGYDENAKDIRDRYTDLPLELASQYGKFEKQEADELARLKKEKELLRYSAIPFAEYGPSILRGAPKFMGFNAGGRVSFKGGGIDKGRRAFMKLLAALGIGTATAGTGLIKLGGKAATKTAVKTGVDVATGTPGMPSWFPALVNKVIKEGDDVTEKLATMDRQVVHTKKLPDGEEVTVYRDLDSGDIRVDYDSIDNMGQEPISLQYTKGEEIYSTGKGYLSSRKTTKEPDRFGASESEPVGHAQGPDDYVIEWEGGDYNSVDDLISDTSRIKNYAEGKKPTMKEIVTRKRKTDETKFYNTSEGESQYIVNKQGDYDDSLPDIDDID